MQSKITIKLSKNNNVNWICFWPFSTEGFQTFVDKSKLFERTQGFLVLDHVFWGEGIHPPKASQVRASNIDTGEIGLIDDFKESVVLNKYLKEIIDFKLFITKNKIDTNILKDYYIKGEHSKILELWGGYIFYIHDAEKLYIDFLNDEKILQLLPELLFPQSSLNDQEYQALWDRLNEINDDKCLLVSVDKAGCLRIKEISEDVQKYENNRDF